MISACAPTSMPRVGSSRMSSRGSVASQRASSTFCWLPPESRPIGRFGIGRADVQRLDVTRRRSRPARGATAADASPRLRLQRQHDVLAHGQLGDDAVGLAVLRAEAEAVAHAVARRLQPHGHAVDARLPAIGALGAEHQPRRLGAARAEQPGEADDLAMAQLEIERRDMPALP